mmetsp:Transcript_18550/g.38936  ORF Transcript_18550/g.38936 Transcript_18550/m.38936 type:complete len:406 (-) Transcript_18550:2300-3517(-)
MSTSSGERAGMNLVPVPIQRESSQPKKKQFHRFDEGKSLLEMAAREAEETGNVSKLSGRLHRTSRRFASGRLGASHNENLSEGAKLELTEQLGRQLSFDLVWDEQTQTWMMADNSPLPAREPLDAGGCSPQDDRTAEFVKVMGNYFLSQMSQPPISLSPYGQFWAMDVVVLNHNALRRELMDGYVIFYSMEVRSSFLRRVDVDLFYAWWETFRNFLLHVLDAEEDIMYPWIEGRCPLEDPRLSQEARNAWKDTLSQILDIIDRAYPKFHLGNISDGVALLKLALDKLVLCLSAQFKVKERLLPPIINANFDERQKRAYDRQFVRYFLHGSSPGADIPILSRWLKSVGDREKEAEWRFDNLGPSLAATHWMKERPFRRHREIVSFFSYKRKEFLANTTVLVSTNTM